MCRYVRERETERWRDRETERQTSARGRNRGRGRREWERGAEGMVIEKFPACFHEHSYVKEFLNKAWWPAWALCTELMSFGRRGNEGIL